MFRAEFEEALARGWAGFTGRLVRKAAPRPTAVPAAYVMQPFEVKLDYRGRAWCTVKFELGHNEIGDAEEPELQLADDLAAMFTEVGLDAPMPVRAMRADHQIAQKLHAVSAEGSECARDLVDLQLLDSREDLDLALVAETCARLFDYRRRQPWPPTVAAPSQWTSLYAEASEDLDVLPSIVEAVDWVNAFIRRIASGGSSKNLDAEKRSGLE
ncbi:hypothetical protein GCM10009591_15180 [Brachybacterium tyrofermentans]